MKGDKKLWFRIFGKLSGLGLLNWIPDCMYLKICYRGEMHKKLNLKEPKTFNEKLQWLKLHDRKPEHTMMVDKYEAKRYVASIIGDEYIIPTLGIWERFEDIDFSTLPNQFVLKCTHDSGGLVICKDKNKLNIDEAKNKIQKCLTRNYFYSGREWPYKNVKPQIIAEKYMTDSEDSQELTDYKIHCFNGVPRVILVCRNRFGNMTEDFFSENWEHIPVERPNHPNAAVRIEEPDELKQMIDLAEKLSKDIPFVRTDFYTINKKIYFGEMTFFPASGMEAFKPEEYDHIWGEWITLPVQGGEYSKKTICMF